MCLVVTLACGEPPGPELDVFRACELGLIESVKQGERELVRECEVQSGWTLIGLPARRVTADELSVAGLVEDSAYMLSHSDKLNWETNRWCVGRRVRECPTSDSARGEPGSEDHLCVDRTPDTGRRSNRGDKSQIDGAAVSLWQGRP